jgi:hypothetical protein
MAGWISGGFLVAVGCFPAEAVEWATRDMSGGSGKQYVAIVARGNGRLDNASRKQKPWCIPSPKEPLPNGRGSVRVAA